MEAVIVRKMKCNQCTNDSDNQCNITYTDSLLTDPKDDRDFLQQNSFLKWTCNICSRKFRTEKILNDHKQSVHEGKWFPCSLCSKTFGSDNSLKAHFKRHTKEPTKMCKLCCKMFFHQNELNQHILSHKKEKTFKCDSCNYTPKYKDNGTPKNHTNIQDTSHLGAIPANALDVNSNGKDGNVPESGTVFTTNVNGTFPHASVTEPYLNVDDTQNATGCTDEGTPASKSCSSTAGTHTITAESVHINASDHMSSCQPVVTPESDNFSVHTHCLTPESGKGNDTQQMSHSQPINTPESDNISGHTEQGTPESDKVNHNN